MGQETRKKLRIIHEFELYKFELDKFDCIWTQEDEINNRSCSMS